ncbi:MAG: hypothetical protein IPH13_22020 [Planctomycetes bacterium]|nr:hypothetical protein [Planctomycetota bacterium]MCC7169458.1 hypothetical protein [Planctomycetota bacterium]
MPALFAFFSSVSFVLSILALTTLLEPMPGASWSDLQTIALVVALGLVVKFAAVDGRIAAFPRRLASMQFAFALVPAAVVRLSTAGPYSGSGLDGIALRGLLLAPLAFTFGQSARRIVLHAGVPKLARLPQCGALIAGIALGFAVWAFGLAQHVGIWTIAFAAPCLVLARLALPVLDRADMPEPEPFEGGLRVLPSLLGGLLVAYGVTVLVRLEATYGGDGDTTHAVGAAALGVAALGVTWVAGNVRRSGLVLGAGALIALAVRALAWTLVPEDSWRATPWARWTLVVLPPALLGVGLALLARAYFGVPRARKILTQIPPDQRRTPSGAPIRAALMAVGIVAGAAVSLAVAPAELFRPYAAIAAVGAALLAFFDPRAGIGRRCVWVALGGAAVVAALMGLGG